MPQLLAAAGKYYDGNMTPPNRQIVRKSTLAEQGSDDHPSTYAVPDAFVELVAARIRSAESYERRVVPGGSLAGTAVEAAEFDAALFKAVKLTNTRWHKLRLLDVRLEKCDVANARWTNPAFEAVALLKCRGTGLQFLDADCYETRFVGCKLNLAAFHGSKFRNCRWENCDLREADFDDAELVDIVFHKCDLRGARFPNCSLKNVDFRGSCIAELQIDTVALRGATIEASQLLDIAALLELNVSSIGNDEFRAE